jgi:hypothetical protein
MRIIRVVHLAIYTINHLSAPHRLWNLPALQVLLFSSIHTHTHTHTHPSTGNYYSIRTAHRAAESSTRPSRQTQTNANARKRTRTQPYACVFLKQISPEIWLPGKKKGNTTCQEKNGTLFASPNLRRRTPSCHAELSCNKLRREVKASSRKDDEASLKCTSKHRSCVGWI